jgi:alkanesulfonate monooxygenase SsuD/methylene tetrahydromethanopterin reductase-like flavin-dependent oxidoreductase (luciferase family)
MLKLGVIFMPRSIKLAVDIARQADRLGLSGLGICDSPILWHELYPVVTACLTATERLAVGPNVTNCVTRHWTIHASSSRTFEELAPGRFYLGVGSGDGAVYGAGMRPATTREMDDALERIRGAAAATTPIQMAASGPRMAAVAGRRADALIAGGGLDASAVGFLRDHAASARTDDRPLETWALVNAHLVADEARTEEAREITLPVAVAYARFNFQHSFEGKNVPPEHVGALTEQLPKYNFYRHAVTTAENANGRLLRDFPEVEDYVVDRFSLVGTPDRCRERLQAFLDESGVDGVWLTVNVPDPAAQVELLADAFGELL